MEITIVEGLRALKFDLVFTLALSALFLFLGYGVQHRVTILARSSIPAPAIGGMLFALIVLALRSLAQFGVGIDTTLRAPLQTAFFTTIGLSATFSLLRAGGWRAAFFWLLASAAAMVQTAVGILLARAMGAPALLGIICGALTLTGGPATGLAFAEAFEGAGITGASALIIASATFGIFTASIVGNPVASLLIRRLDLASPQSTSGGGQREESIPSRRDDAARHKDEHIHGDRPEEIFTGDKEAAGAPEREGASAIPLTGDLLFHNLLLILVIMGVGALLSFWLTRLGVTLPGYVGAMVMAALVRNIDDRFGWFRVNARAVEAWATAALALFLVIALMDLKLWQLAGMALPMLAILLVQVFLMIAYAVFVTFVLMGRDYEAAVTASGHIGFGLGITPNAIANMDALVERFRPAPRSFLIVPVVGAFFIDFSNAIIITIFINLVR